MKLHFPWSDIEKLLTEVITATTARPLYGEKTGKGLWLVGDQGVYLMANTTDGEVNSKRREGDKHVVVYAAECDPTKLPFEEWWNNKRASFGGDDGVEFFPLADIVAYRKNDPTHLVIEFQGNNIAIFTERRKSKRS
ncbi:DUF3085 domain-containing protein [Hyphomicrobium sp. DY-1]|uniref:DUF3085 domain-containing protein n=1 Tax=Hyphomicrobium sp. DY-1 TaxID=3075650 RepID=UPI0039C0442D